MDPDTTIGQYLSNLDESQRDGAVELMALMLDATDETVDPGLRARLEGFIAGYRAGRT